ncbi:Glucose-methanol-choline oxidoreductase, C-terminal,Glucose-methanol-choline oxidoreductase, N- [Cinara cedri]|uniref:Glucose-methanol-choline oxidoreductase, C-terminal,Glucose-methanol-choline oxidoreductase, N n=1 Tax=Cinara cedri TaxID=506608 RepID=A0A5E4MF04_9HEMI|nr:Glucose-methanol-choline oxidoreductase, C-terminal,Glucose-methanol-choline oxidoreductase, N- [Cinara cedri]
MLWKLYLILQLGTIYTNQQSTDYPPLFEGLLNILNEGVEFMNRQTTEERVSLREYDFIVVGAGSAGSVVANRLSEVPTWNVLLIEAGNEEHFVMDIPLLANVMQFTEANWKYKTMPSDKYCLGMNNRQCKFPRGKVMGGSSVLNYMIYTRGHRKDYDDWANAGNIGWGYDDVLKYFLKSENANLTFQDPGFHQKGGLLSVTEVPYKTSLSKAFVQAGYEIGYPPRDLNGKSQIGFDFLQVTMKNGLRYSTNAAFLRPIRNRKNLFIRKQSQVTKILFDETGSTAIGVEYYTGKQKHRIFARKEVIISCGAINSPQLLMLSGIGPKDHLISKNIKVLRDLPAVGRNLMDHVAMGSLVYTNNDTSSIFNDRAFTSNSLYDFLKRHHTGFLSIPGSTEALALIDVNQMDNLNAQPNLELLFINGAFSGDTTIQSSFNLNDDVYNRVYKKTEGKNMCMIFPMIMKPKSKGWIELKDNNPFRYPAIYPNYFSDERDLDIVVAGARINERLMKTNAMKSINATLWDIPIPGCDNLKFNSDDYWKCVARYLSITIYHLCGTCKMGPIGDPTAVVDPRLRVQGINRLRVIDASIMPDIPAAHLNAPTIMIGEKGSDLIKEDWGINI